MTTVLIRNTSWATTRQSSLKDKVITSGKDQLSKNVFDLNFICFLELQTADGKSRKAFLIQRLIHFSKHLVTEEIQGGGIFRLSSFQQRQKYPKRLVLSTVCFPMGTHSFFFLKGRTILKIQIDLTIYLWFLMQQFVVTILKKSYAQGLFTKVTHFIKEKKFSINFEKKNL